jgi:hypothetical protein
MKKKGILTVSLYYLDPGVVFQTNDVTLYSLITTHWFLITHDAFCFGSFISGHFA